MYVLVLVYPNLTDEFILNADALGTAIGVELIQVQGGKNMSSPMAVCVNTFVQEILYHMVRVLSISLFHSRVSSLSVGQEIHSLY